MRGGKPGNAGNRTSNRGKPPKRAVVIDKDIATALERYAPDIQLQQLVDALLVEFLIKLGYPFERKEDKGTS